MAEPIRVADLARGARLSVSRFAHLFRMETGVAPAEFLHALRMRNARALLERTFLTVKEVRSLVGCNDGSHFTRDFRRFHGMAPRAWRARPNAAAAEDDDSTDMTATVSSTAALADERQHPPTEIDRRQPDLAAIVNRHNADKDSEE